MVVFFQVLPEKGGLDELSDFRGSKVEFLRGASCKVDERFSHAASLECLVAAVKLGVGLLHEGNPELVGVGTVTIQWSL